MLIDELIEKAFSDGYEYALMEQREFASFVNMGRGLAFNGAYSKPANKATWERLLANPTKNSAKIIGRSAEIPGLSHGPAITEIKRTAQSSPSSKRRIKEMETAAHNSDVHARKMALRAERLSKIKAKANQKNSYNPGNYTSTTTWGGGFKYN